MRKQKKLIFSKNSIPLGWLWVFAITMLWRQEILEAGSQKKKIEEVVAKETKLKDGNESGSTGKDQQVNQGGEGVVNINTASQEQLCYLPGIGAKKASRIITVREKKPFKSPLELIRVKGIGRKTLKKLMPYLTVTGETTLKAKIKIKEK